MPEADSNVEYREVKGFPGYRVGSDGSVWTQWQRIYLGWRYGTTYRIGPSWHRMSPGKGTSGHLIVTLCRTGRRYTRMIHRLVLEAFVGPRPKGMQARHFPDRDPANNSLLNLQWGTAKQNQEDRLFHGTDIRGEKHGRAKLTEEQVREIRRIGTTEQQRVIARRFNVSQKTVLMILKGRIWKHVK